MRLILLAAVSLLIIGAEASAQTVIKGDDKVVYKPRTTVDFSTCFIDALPTKPEGQYAFGHPKFKFDSLIKLRVSFKPELEKSVERL